MSTRDAQAPITPPPDSPPSSGGGHDGLPKDPNLLYGLLAVLAAGLGVSLYLVRHKLLLASGLLKHSSCNYGGALNCDAVNTSPWSELLGLPISLFGIPTYAVMAYLVFRAMRALSSTDKATREDGAISLQLTAAIGVLTVLYTMYLAYISSAKIGAYCVYCMSLYAVNLVATILAVLAGPRTLGDAIQGSIQALMGAKSAVVASFGVVVIVLGLSYVGHDKAKVHYEALGVECSIDASKCFDTADAATVAAAGDAVQPVAGDSAVPPASVQQVAAGTAAAGRAPVADRNVQVVDPGSLPQRRLMPVSDTRTGGEKTAEDGWTEVYYPLDDEQEFWFGNPSAKVTVVKVADFQCPYCRYLALSFEPVMKKYQDKVRFVMKHFPMNVKCNRWMAGYDKHPYACEASTTGHCAGMQGKFWEMHDKMYANQQALEPESLRKYAEEVGLDLAKYDACLISPQTSAYIANDIQMAIRAGIYGTPKTYINGRLVTGSASKSILEYHIERAIKEAEGGSEALTGGQEKVAPKPDGTQMIEAKKEGGTFWIDPYEASITKAGKAAPVPGVEPAWASWYQAQAACAKAGKRLCTEEEWVSACAGQPAKDDNNNGMFGEDTVEGNMYPYGVFYQAQVCNDQGDKYKGMPVEAGIKEKCRTPSGIFDLAGNISEWISEDKTKATLMGGHAASGERAACNDRSYGNGNGRRNHTTGFRCCADSNVRSAKVNPSDLRPTAKELVGNPVPQFKVKAADGREIDSSTFKGKVTLVNFFASWCGPCKKEIPFLVRHAEDYKAKGFQIVGVGVDTDSSRSVEFAKEHGATWPILADSDSVLFGDFLVYSMPATYLVDRSGVIRYKDTGFKPEEQAEKLKQAIESLL